MSKNYLFTGNQKAISIDTLSLKLFRYLTSKHNLFVDICNIKKIIASIFLVENNATDFEIINNIKFEQMNINCSIIFNITIRQLIYINSSKP